MENQRPDIEWLEVQSTIGLNELASLCRMSTQDLQELVDYGALMPLPSPQAEPVFSFACLKPLRAAEKLRRDYDLDLFVVVVAMDLLQRIDALELQVHTLQATTVATYR